MRRLSHYRASMVGEASHNKDHNELWLYPGFHVEISTRKIKKKKVERKLVQRFCVSLSIGVERKSKNCLLHRMRLAEPVFLPDRMIQNATKWVWICSKCTWFALKMSKTLSFSLSLSSLHRFHRVIFIIFFFFEILWFCSLFFVSQEFSTLFFLQIHCSNTRNKRLEKDIDRSHSKHTRIFIVILWACETLIVTLASFKSSNNYNVAIFLFFSFFHCVIVTRARITTTMNEWMLLLPFAVNWNHFSYVCVSDCARVCASSSLCVCVCAVLFGISSKSFWRQKRVVLWLNGRKATNAARDNMIILCFCYSEVFLRFICDTHTNTSWQKIVTHTSCSFACKLHSQRQEMAQNTYSPWIRDAVVARIVHSSRVMCCSKWIILKLFTA